jgi:hypothetical protein
MAPLAARLRVAERADSLCEVDVHPVRWEGAPGDGGAQLETSLRERCAGCVTVTAFWHTGAQHPLAVLALASAGWAGLVAVLTPRCASGEEGQGGGDSSPHHPLARLHAECLAAPKTAVAAPLASGRELHLVAVPGSPCFWCVAWRGQI